MTVHQTEMLAALTVIPAWLGAIVYSYRRWQHADRQHHTDSHQSHVRLVTPQLYDQDDEPIGLTPVPRSEMTYCRVFQVGRPCAHPCGDCARTLRTLPKGTE